VHPPPPPVSDGQVMGDVTVGRMVNERDGSVSGGAVGLQVPTSRCVPGMVRLVWPYIGVRLVWSISNRHSQVHNLPGYGAVQVKGRNRHLQAKHSGMWAVPHTCLAAANLARVLLLASLV
jgi:hypothetical protein